MMSRNSSESNNSWLALAGGIEPPTHCLQGSCSAPELRQHRRNSNLVSKLVSVKEFLSSGALAGGFVAKDRDGGTHIERSHLARHGDRQERVAGFRDQGPH